MAKRWDDRLTVLVDIDYNLEALIKQLTLSEVQCGENVEDKETSPANQDYEYNFNYLPNLDEDDDADDEPDHDDCIKMADDEQEEEEKEEEETEIEPAKKSIKLGI